MLSKLKESLTSLVVDYIAKEIFNTVLLPILSLLAPLITLLLLRLVNTAHRHNISTWQVVLFLIVYFIAGIMIGWRFRTAWSSREAKLKGQIVISRFELFCLYDENHIPSYVDTYRKIHSKRERPVKTLPIVIGYYTDTGYRDIELKALNFGAIENVRPTRLNRLTADFVFDNELAPGGTAEMRYRINILNNQQEPPPYQTIRALFGPIKEAKITVRFATNAVPKYVWRAQWLDGVEGEPELLGEPLKPITGTTYETTFRNLPGGLNIEYGLYWEW